MAKKQSIPTTRKIFSMIDGLELASMHLHIRKIEEINTKYCDEI